MNLTDDVIKTSKCFSSVLLCLIFKEVCLADINKYYISSVPNNSFQERHGVVSKSKGLSVYVETEIKDRFVMTAGKHTRVSFCFFSRVSMS